MSVVVRRAEPEDAEAINAIAADCYSALRGRYGLFDVDALIELNFLTVTALNEEGLVVGFASLCDTPPDMESEAWLDWNAAVTKTKHITVANTLWLTFFVAEEGFGAEVSENIIRTAFSTLPDIDNLVLLSAPEGGLDDALAGSFLMMERDVEKGVELDKSGQFVTFMTYRCGREDFIRPPPVRRARVEDHDDLVPIFNTQSEVLTDVFGEFFLAELIEAQDDTNKALVCEVGGRAAGLMALSGDVSLDVLGSCFDLSVYNGLSKRTKAEEAAATHTEAAVQSIRSDWLAQLEAHDDELEAVFDSLAPPGAPIEEEGEGPDEEGPVLTKRVVQVFDAQGELWGFASDDGMGLGAQMLYQLGLSDETEITRQALNEAVEAYADARTQRSLQARLERWVAAVGGKVALMRLWDDCARGSGSDRVPVGVLMDAVEALRPIGLPSGPEAAEALFEQLHAAVGEDRWGAGGAISNLDSPTAGGESKDADGAEGKGDEADGGGDGDGEAKGGDGEGGDGGAGAGEEPSMYSVEDVGVTLSRDQFSEAIDLFMQVVRKNKIIRVFMVGPKGSGTRTQASLLAQSLGVPTVSVASVLEDAANELKDDDEGGDDEDDPFGEGSDDGDDAEDTTAAPDGGLWQPVLLRIQEPDCAGGFVLHDLPREVGPAKELSSALEAAGFPPQLTCLLAISKEVCLERATDFERDGVAASWDSWERNMDDVVPVIANGGTWVTVGVDSKAPPEAVNDALLVALRRHHVIVSGSNKEIAAEREAELVAIDAAKAMAAGIVEDREPNAFAVTLFCVDESLESRAQDFLEHAFACYPDREYCLLTLPHSSAETPLVSKFGLASPLPSSTFSHVLYVCHRASLLAPMDMVIRRLTLNDRLGVLNLVHDLPDERAIIASTATVLSGPVAGRLDAIVALVQDQVVGVAFLDGAAVGAEQLEALRSSYEIDRYLQLDHHPAATAVKLAHFALNPIFMPSARYFLRTSLRIAGVNSVFLQQAATAPIPGVLREFLQVRPRALPDLRPGEVVGVPYTKEGGQKPIYGGADKRRIEEGGTPPPTPITPDVNPRAMPDALFFLTRKLMSETKLAVNSRIVVVGASDTGLSFVEQLLMVPYLNLSHVTLISPGGIPPSDTHVSSSGRTLGSTSHWFPDAAYTPKQLGRLAIPSSVRVVDALVAEIDRPASAVVLADGAIVPYDVLVLTPGLTEPTAARLRLHEGDPRLMGRIVHTLTNHAALPALDEMVPALNEMRFKKGVRDTLVYGAGLEAITALQALIDRGVSPRRILFLSPKPDPAAALPRTSAIPECLAESVPGAAVLAALNEAKCVVATGTLEAVDPVDDETAMATLLIDEDGKTVEQSMLCRLIVCGDTRDVDPDFFAAVNDCGLVYDGRLVVNHRFQTAGDNIYAAGTITKFSRRYRSQHWMQGYNSKEVGRALAEAVLMKVDPLQVEDDVGEIVGPELLPKFTEARHVAAILPGNLFFFHASLPVVDVGVSGRQLVTPRILEEETKDAEPDTTNALLKGPEKERETPIDVIVPHILEHKSSIGHTRIVLDRHERVAALTYIGRLPIEVGNLSTLVGRHATTLNAMQRDYDAELIKDFIKFFREEWAVAVYHDRFTSLCQELMATFETDGTVASLVESIRKVISEKGDDKLLAKKRADFVGVAGANLARDTRLSIQTRLIEFLKRNKSLLNMYSLPAGK